MSSKKQISIIVAALLPKFGIGYNNQLPWRLSNEMKYFRKTTIGQGLNAVIMGRKTWDSIPEKFRPLKDRINVVITRNQELTSDNDNVLYFNSIDDALSHLKVNDKVNHIFIIGGAQIYESTLPFIDNVLLTEIQNDTDSSIPMDSYLNDQYIKENFKKAQHSELEQLIGFTTPDEHIKEGDFSYKFTLYKRNPPLTS